MEEKRKRIAWNKGLKRTKEEKEKQLQTLLLKYRVTNPSQITEVRQKLKDMHASGEWLKKVKQTNLDRYGNSNYNNPDKFLNTKLERYGNKNYNNPSKMVETKRKNRSFNTSKIEETLNIYLINKYGKEDVFRNFNKDPRYPFAVDFYIKSLDLFIELNIHPCHYFKPYNKELYKEELEKLKEKSKTSDYYKNIIYVWTISDPLKQETALKNGLNYKTYYNTGKVLEDMESNLI